MAATIHNAQPSTTAVLHHHVVIIGAGPAGTVAFSLIW
jgi:cation diffusion facilitator CzcD-associated flavoprotein CzcO